MDFAITGSVERREDEQYVILYNCRLPDPKNASIIVNDHER